MASDTKTKLTAEDVQRVMRACLFKDGEPHDDHIKVEGVMRSFGFHPGRIAEHTPEIKAFLGELSDEFRMDAGGGWTFLNACNDRYGNHWGEHPDMEALFCLGIAAGAAKWLMPREMWSVLPGGVPYVGVTP